MREVGVDESRIEQPAEDLVREFDRLYVPRNDPRWLRRNALVAAGNVGTDALAPSVVTYATSADPMLAETATWALARQGARSS